MPELVSYARGVLDAVGMRWGAAHIEIMLTADGPRLIEVGARPHGGGQPRFCRVATGDSQVDRTARYFAGGRIPNMFELRRQVSVVFLMARRAGVVIDPAPLERARELTSYIHGAIHIRAGDRVEVTKDLFGSLELGFVVLAHERADQVDADYTAFRALERAVKIERSRA